MLGPAPRDAALDDPPGAGPEDWPVTCRCIIGSLCGSAESRQGRTSRSLLCAASLAAAALPGSSATIGRTAEVPAHLAVVLPVPGLGPYLNRLTEVTPRRQFQDHREVHVQDVWGGLL